MVIRRWVQNIPQRQSSKGLTHKPCLYLKGHECNLQTRDEVKQVKNQRSAHKILSQGGNGTRKYCVSLTLEFFLILTNRNPLRSATTKVHSESLNAWQFPASIPPIALLAPWRTKNNQQVPPPDSSTGPLHPVDGGFIVRLGLNRRS